MLTEEVRANSGETSGSTLIEGSGVIGHDIGLTNLVQVWHVQFDYTWLTGGEFSPGSKSPWNFIIRFLVTYHFIRGWDLHCGRRHRLRIDWYGLHTNFSCVVGINCGASRVLVSLHFNVSKLLCRERCLEIREVKTQWSKATRSLLHISELELQSVITSRGKSASDRNIVGYWDTSRWVRVKERRVVRRILVRRWYDKFKAHVWLPSFDSGIWFLKYFNCDSWFFAHVDVFDIHLKTWEWDYNHCALNMQIS